MSYSVSAAAFKAGKIQNNPFSQAPAAGGVAIPPPASLQAGDCLIFTCVRQLVNVISIRCVFLSLFYCG
jgi:hypothetical protein